MRNYLNLSKKRYSFRSADGFVVSIPKCGRTWLHFMIQYYYCTKNKIPFKLYTHGQGENRIPNIVFTHDLWEHRTAKKPLDRFKGKFLIPSDCRNTRPTLLLTRDLRDVMVSLYFQVTKREQIFSGSISELIVDPVLGADAAVNIINSWWNELRQSDMFIHTSYENLTLQTEYELARILSHFGEPAPDMNIVAEAIQFSNFTNMQEMERDQKISDVILTPGDSDDPESFKVRRGIVGGYKDYMSEMDIFVIEYAMGNLKVPPSLIPSI